MRVCHLKSMDRKLAFNIWIACFSFINQTGNYMYLDSYILCFYCLKETKAMIDLENIMNAHYATICFLIEQTIFTCL